MKNAKVYVVTNATYASNYTPSIFKNESDARNWFYELAIGDAIDAFDCDMSSYLAESIKEKCEDIVNELRELLEAYKNEPEIADCGCFEDDDEKNIEYTRKANEIIERFNEQMGDDNPFRICKIDNSFDIDDVIYSFLDEYDEEEFDLYSLIEGKEKEYVEFFGNEISGFEYNNNKIILEYSDDSFNCIEIFAVEVQ